MDILIATLAVGVIGLVLGAALVATGKKFHVETDPREAAVRELLPGNNCGACGYAGCDAVAAAIAKGEAPANACPVCSSGKAEQIASVMGVEAQGLERRVAFVRCGGDCEKTSVTSRYTGVADCRSAALAGLNPWACPYGCLGFGSCAAACNYDAIHAVDGVAVVDSSRLQFDGERLRLEPGQAVDFGGAGKGYAAQRVMEIYREHGIRSGMVSLGGNVQVLGAKPDKTPWRIGVRDPDSGGYFAVLSLEDKAAVTSGGYERYFEADGRTYIHILDPRTGRPAESDLLSVTVVSEDGARADALSTALFLKGREDAASFWRERGGFDMVLVTADREILITEGLQRSFEAEESPVVLTRTP